MLGFLAWSRPEKYDCLPTTCIVAVCVVVALFVESQAFVWMGIRGRRSSRGNRHIRGSSSSASGAVRFNINWRIFA